MHNISAPTCKHPLQNVCSHSNLLGSLNFIKHIGHRILRCKVPFTSDPRDVEEEVEREATYDFISSSKSVPIIPCAMIAARKGIYHA